VHFAPLLYSLKIYLEKLPTFSISEE